MFGITKHRLKAQSIIITIAGNGTQGYSGDGGEATIAKINYPEGVAIDAMGNIYIADNQSFCIRKVNSLGIISTIAGIGVTGFSGDGGQATAAELGGPTGIAVDAAGNIYIADNGSNRVRKVNTLGIISTVAGNGTIGYSGDGGQATAAEFRGPGDVITDALGNLYIADGNNNVIRKVNIAGIITTVAGNGTQGYSGDGGAATVAELYASFGVAVDAMGNLYIGDAGNNVIRKVNTAGIITTVAGTGTQGYSGDGGQATAAELGITDDVAIDAVGNIYIADYDNNVIRKVNTAGIISTIVGNGTQGYSGDGSVATLAEINNPDRVTSDAMGNIYFGEDGNYRVRKVSNVWQMGIEQYGVITRMVKVYPNPATNNLNIDYTTESDATFVLYDVNGRVVLKQTLNANQNHVELNGIDLPNGLYMYNINNTDGQNLQKGKVTILK